MNKILNWTVGSFFRTIGRTIAFLVMGGLIYFILSSNGIDFGIKNLFFDKVDALTLTSEVQANGSGYMTVTETTYTDYARSYWFTKSNGADATYHEFTFTSALNTSDSDYLTFGIQFGQPTQSTISWTNTNDQIQCRKWYCTAYSGDTCDKWQCESNGWYVVSEDTITDHVQTDYEMNKFSVYAFVTATDGNWYSCSWQENEVVCPVNRRNISKLTLSIKYDTARTSNIQIGVNRGWNKWKNVNIQGAIESQTQQQQQQHQEMMDSNTTQAESDAQDFFEGFNVDLGGLTGIITAPLNTIQSLLNSTCTNLVLPLPFVNKNLTLPCMNDIYTEHFGLFFSLYQTIILGIIAYRCIMSIFFDIKGFSNPDDDRIEVMDL